MLIYLSFTWLAEVDIGVILRTSVRIFVFLVAISYSSTHPESPQHAITVQLARDGSERFLPLLVSFPLRVIFWGAPSVSVGRELDCRAWVLLGGWLLMRVNKSATWWCVMRSSSASWEAENTICRRNPNLYFQPPYVVGPARFLGVAVVGLRVLAVPSMKPR